MRLHTRMMVRDGEDVFLGSQSLRTAELDARREVGLIFHDPKIAARLIETFEDDWKESQNGKAKLEKTMSRLAAAREGREESREDGDQGFAAGGSRPGGRGAGAGRKRKLRSR